MTSKAQIERLVQLARVSQGKDTKRSLKDILASEKAAAAQFVPGRPPVAPAAVTPQSEGGE